MLINILTIAGSDSGGGAGIRGDLKSISATGAYGLSVITATAQNTVAVNAIYPADIFSKQQLRSSRTISRIERCENWDVRNT